MMFSDEDYHDRDAMRLLIYECVELLSTSSNTTDMLQRGIKLIRIMSQQESEIQAGQRERLVNIRQIASELQNDDQGGMTAFTQEFIEMAGALDLDMLLPPYGDTYMPYNEQTDKFA